MDQIHRFTDPDYASLSLKLRIGTDPGAVFDALHSRGQVALHASEVERTAALTELSSTSDELVIADTREQVAHLNAAIRDHRLTTYRHTSRDRWTIPTARGEEIGIGDRVATRRNDPALGVANRQTWIVTGIDDDGSLVVHENGQAHHRDHQLPADYVKQHVELAYATTAYGAQGETVPRAHVVVGESTSAAAAYVGMTRGRENNTAHIVADTVDQARRQWIEVFGRDRADLGPGRARQRAIEDIDRYGPRVPRRRQQGQAVVPRLQPPAPAYRPPVAAPDHGIGV